MKKSKAVLSLLLLIVYFFIGGSSCMDDKVVLQSKSTYIEKVCSALSDKYGIEFEVDSIGGLYGTQDDSTVKLYCYATEGEYQSIKFMAEIDKESLDVVDSYLALVKSDEFSKMIMTENPDCFVLTSIDTLNNYLEIQDRDPNLFEYINSFDSVFITSFVFFEDNYISNEQKAESLYDLALSLEKYNLSDLSIVAFYLDNLDENSIKQGYNLHIERAYDYFVNEYEINNFTGLQITNGKVVSNIDSIINNFERQ